MTTNTTQSIRLVRTFPFLISVMCLSAAPSEVNASVTNTLQKPVWFSADTNSLPLEGRSRRKWDSPIIADLDKDGLMDVILTEHGHRVNVCWNEGGTFSEPNLLIHGDIHGQTAADYDRDGNIDIIIYPGGGGGNNPRNPTAFRVDGRTFEESGSFDHFERCRGRSLKLVDFDNNGTLELVTSGFALQNTHQITEGANLLYHLDGSNEFQFVSRLPHTLDRLGMRHLVTDFNNDGDYDLFIFGGKQIAVAKGGDGLAFSDQTATVLGDLSAIEGVSAMMEVDFDNDGDFDLFLTRSEHPFNHRSNHDSECQCFAFFARFKPMEMDDLKIEGDFKLENLQMAYPHFDVMVGAEKRILKFDVDRHGHKEFTLKPEEAMGWPNDTSKKGLYIGYLGDQWWRVYSDTKSPTAGVIHNVVSTPATIPSENMPAKLLENRDGVFVDVTEQMGISINEQTTGGAVADFDNDGWSDLFIIRYGTRTQPTEQILYKNNAGKGFSQVENHGVVSQELGSTGLAAEIFDYDMDGDADILYCNERGRWHLMNNELKTSNNYLVVKVGDSPSRKATSLGATLSLKIGDHIYKRYVGQTASSFGQNANYYLQVGIGAADKVDSAVVRWTTGESVELEVEGVNRTISAGRFPE